LTRELKRIEKEKEESHKIPPAKPKGSTEKNNRWIPKKGRRATFK